jgi:hypothetical protein
LGKNLVKSSNRYHTVEATKEVNVHTAQNPPEVRGTTTVGESRNP